MQAFIIKTTKLFDAPIHCGLKFESEVNLCHSAAFSQRPGGEQKDIEVLKQEAKLVIEDYDPSKEYNFKIIAVSGGQQSKPLQAKHEAQQSGVAMVQFQKRQDSGTREENNEISEGKFLKENRKDWRISLL
ncbi:hypothetical protein NQZ68_031093 [Dissostichus eleginoides]|nr:hypothetical protein NQZ68_031093 [Dissostichus eleginoides]